MSVTLTMTLPDVKHVSFLRPFVMLALPAVLVGGGLGVVFLLQLHLSLGPVSPASLREHGQVQVFGFLVPFVVGFATFVVPRIAGGHPLRHQRLVGVALAGSATALVATLAAYFGPLAAWVVFARLSGALVAVSSVAAAWALAVPLRQPGISERGYVAIAGLALAFLALAGCVDGVGWWVSTDGRTLSEGVAMAAWRLAIEGFATGMALAVSARMFPGFLGIDPRRAYPAPASARAGSPGSNRVFWLATGTWSVGTAVGSLGFLLGVPGLQWLGDLSFAAGAIPFSLRLGLGASGGVAIDRTRDRFFPWGARSSYALLALGSTVGAAASAAALLGLPIHAFWWDARRHLITIGFLMTLIATMSGRLAPGYAGRPLALPALRSLALFAFPLAAILRAVEAVAGQWGPASLLWISAASGPVAMVGFLALAVSVGTTLFRRAQG